MADVTAILGVVLLFIGIVMIALLGNSRSLAWGAFIGVGLVILGLGIEVFGAVVAAA